MSEPNGKSIHPIADSESDSSVVASAPQRGDALWAVTCYFNPVGYRRRLSNYRLFRQRLAAPLVTVELSYRGEFELKPGDADRLIQLRGEDVLWQKERLLNVALRALPPSCRYVVWLDCDVIFARDDWPADAARLLDEYRVVQLFRHLYHLPREWAGGVPRVEACDFHERSFVSAVAEGMSPSRPSLRTDVRSAGDAAKGVAWAARREILDAHGFFDGCIVGGGDSAMACAAYGCFDYVNSRQSFNELQEQYYLRWARPFHDAVGRATSFVDVDLFHLWHGEMRDRRYRDRHDGLRPFRFNPAADVKVDDSGCWRWNSDKPHLHAYVRDYFATRNEDGA